MLPIWICVLFACVGGNYTFFPSVINETFGPKYSGVIIGFMLLSEIPASIIFTIMDEAVKSLVGGWFYVTIFYSFFGLISTTMSVLYSPKIDREKWLKRRAQRSFEARNSFSSSAGMVHKE